MLRVLLPTLVAVSGCFLLAALSLPAAGQASSLLKDTSDEASSSIFSSVDEVVARLETSPHLRYYDWMSQTGQDLALLDAMHGDSDVRHLVDKEAAELGFSSSSSERPRGRGSRPSTRRRLNTQFTCTPFGRGPQPPTSVHALTPADVDVIGAIGDSLSAGTGIDACSVFTMTVQYRGRVFHTGGDGDVASNPSLNNLLRRYNPNIVGFSTGKGDFNSKGAGFNVANPGDTSLDLMPQAQRLVSRMKEKLKDGDAFSKSWKLVTVLMGNNDVCKSCKKDFKDKISPELYRERLQAALDYLQANLPRTFVNLVTIVDTYLMKELNIGLVCSTIHRFGCSCAAYPKNYDALVALNQQIQKTADDLILSGRYDNDTQFTVVAQPFFEETTLPRNKEGKVDLSFFSPDCFHFSGVGHAATALALWNSMFEPVGQKKRFWHLNEPYECPTQAMPYFRTAKN